MKTTIKINGTNCASCKALIEDVCHEIPGVTKCEVDYRTGATVVEHDEGLSWEQFKKVIEGLGNYKVQLP